MKSFRLLCAAGLLLALSAASAWAGPIAQIVSFGDSLSDAGNSFAQYGYPSGALGSPYSNGRFSNGPIWLDQLAVRMQLATSLASKNGGMDYAYGGATADSPINGVPTGFAPLINPALQFIGVVPNVSTQIATYLKTNTPNSGTLYTLWAGANDFFDGQTNPLKPADNLMADIETLIGKGAKNFLVANLPALGETPLGKSQGQAVRQGLDALTAGFNAELSADLAKIRHDHPDVVIHQLDAFGLFQKVMANPAAYGLTNATDPAYNFFAPPGPNNPNPGIDGFLFLDGVHPTATGGRIIADAAYAAVAPEPSSVALLLTGCAGFLGCVRLARRKR